jgi:hypothetical protein
VDAVRQVDIERTCKAEITSMVITRSKKTQRAILKKRKEDKS